MIWVSLIIMVGYLSFVLAKFGVPRSISDTYYLLGSKGWVFQLSLALVAFTVLPVMLEKSGESTQFLAFLSCSGLLFVASAPMFKLSLEGAVHYTSAAVCCVGLVLWQIFNTSWIIPTVCFALVCYPMFKDRNYLWWIEIATIVSSYVSLIIF